MPSKSANNSGPLVPHPRYGSAPRPSGLKISEEEIRQGFWRLLRDTIYPETVLRANIKLQNYAVFPRAYYVDVLRQCRNCKHPFIFFAQEQRYWFETLRLFVDADCVLCPLCRRESRTIQRRLRRYSDNFARPALSAKELMQLVDDAIYLLERGVLKNLDNLGAVKNRAMKQIPEYAAIEVLIKAIHTAHQQQNIRIADTV